MSFQTELVEGGWSLRRALNLGALSEIAYAPESDIKFTLSEDMDLELTDFMPDRASQGFVAEGDKLVVLAFCGTNQFTDWLVNLRFVSASTDWGRTHRGFLAAYEKIQDNARAAALRAKTADKPLWITGHSLGGALAHVAAYDLLSSGARMGLCTFGQPRSVRADTALEDVLPEGYHRVVNGRDVVTRVPPTLPHTGDLVSIGRRGWFSRGAESTETSEAELPPLSETEFEELQTQLSAIESRAARGAEAAESVDRSVEGLIPGIKDHRMPSYMAELRALVPDTDTESDDDGLFIARRPSPPSDGGRRRPGGGIAGGVFGGPDRSGTTRGGGALETADSFGPGAPSPSPMPAPELMPVLVRLIDTAWQPDAGVQVLSRSGAFVTARATPDAIQAMERNRRQVKSVEVSRAAGFLELTGSRPFVKGAPVDRPGIDETGTNAIVGVIDTGIDVLHKAFHDAGGRSRIVAVWDQYDNSGPTPRQVNPDFSFDFGTLYTHQDIEDMRTGARPVDSWMRDPAAHGTHVAGIAAGRATGSLPDGIAPDAKIAVVMPSMMMDAERQDPNSLGYSVSHINALQFLRAFALSQDMPIAINVSLGMNAGAHDGKTLLEAAFDSITSQGGDPGIAIIKSAGNERRHRGHCHVDVALGRVDVDWASYDIARDIDYFEAWYNHMDRLEFVLRGPHGDETDPVSHKNRSTSAFIDGNLVRMRVRPKHPDNGDNALYITIEPDSQPIRPGPWKLEVRGLHVSAQTTGLHIWVERSGERAVRFINSSERHTLSVPGTAEEIITVGATDLRSPFPGVIDASSYGPTRRNAAKPELSAPGLEIVSAAANQSDLSAARPDTGTSMAAPHVTGAIALALSRRVGQNLSQFNTQQLRSFLVETVQYGSGVHNNGFGFGILDIAAFLEACDQEP